MIFTKINNDVLFLTLDTFSSTGGIQKVCRSMAKALAERKSQHPGLNRMHLLSLGDATGELMEEYIPKKQFEGFRSNRSKFILTAVFYGRKSRTIMLSHINLLPVAFLIKVLCPKKRIILIAHGIEVWRHPGKFAKSFLNKSVEIWAVSRFTANHLHQVSGIKRQHIHILPNCLDPFLTIPDTFIKPPRLLTRHHLANKQPVLLTVTRLSEFESEKGYDSIILCLPALIKAYPSLKYLLAGKCDLQEEQRLNLLIERLNLQKHVSLVGYIPEDDLTDYYLLCDVFLMPSKKEGFGLVLIEAAACGSSIIAGNKDGSADALLRGQLGTLVDPDSTDEIIQAVHLALSTQKNISSSYSRQQLTIEHYAFDQYKINVEALLS
jgi:glycosyltransferase involved in cell wall biosynthesis